MRIVAISDTHEKQASINLPDGDMLLHAGDWTKRGEFAAMHKFLEWFVKQPHKYKVFIPGNHELSLDSANKHNATRIVKQYLGDNIHYLINESVEIEGFKIYGSPASPIWNTPWAFQFQRGKDIAIEWEKIPLDTNILITHGPPYGILDTVAKDWFDPRQDLHQGCKQLTNKLQELDQLKFHVYGHLHQDGGQTRQLANTIFANAAVCDDVYNPSNNIVVVDL